MSITKVRPLLCTTSIITTTNRFFDFVASPVSMIYSLHVYISIQVQSGELIKAVKYFSYLGITLESNGKFHTAITELSPKAAKIQGDNIETSSETWGHESKEESSEV